MVFFVSWSADDRKENNAQKMFQVSSRVNVRTTVFRSEVVGAQNKLLLEGANSEDVNTFKRR